MAKLNISELDFDAVKTQFKQYLQSQTQFKDYNLKVQTCQYCLMY